MCKIVINKIKIIRGDVANSLRCNINRNNYIKIVCVCKIITLESK